MVSHGRRRPGRLRRCPVGFRRGRSRVRPLASRRPLPRLARALRSTAGATGLERAVRKRVVGDIRRSENAVASRVRVVVRHRAGADREIDGNRRCVWVAAPAGRLVLGALATAEPAGDLRIARFRNRAAKVRFPGHSAAQPTAMPPTLADSSKPAARRSRFVVATAADPRHRHLVARRRAPCLPNRKWRWLMEG